MRKERKDETFHDMNYVAEVLEKKSSIVTMIKSVLEDLKGRTGCNGSAPSITNAILFCSLLDPIDHSREASRCRLFIPLTPPSIPISNTEII